MKDMNELVHKSKARVAELEPEAKCLLIQVGSPLIRPPASIRGPHNRWTRPAEGRPEAAV
jgi:hypothetical protein